MSYYFTNDSSLKSEIKKIDMLINKLPFSFYTDNGVFSKSKLDFGTRTLLENLPKISGKVLDIGCGYGPIGIFISKKYNLNVDMIDINLRSINLAIKNAKLNNVNVNIFESNLYEKIDKKYDFIISNPPIRVGKEILFKLLFEAKDHLKDNGEMWIVINKDQGAKSTLKQLNKIYNTSVIAKNKGFYVICCKNN